MWVALGKAVIELLLELTELKIKTLPNDIYEQIAKIYFTTPFNTEVSLPNSVVTSLFNNTVYTSLPLDEKKQVEATAESAATFEELRLSLVALDAAISGNNPIAAIHAATVNSPSEGKGSTQARMRSSVERAANAAAREETSHPIRVVRNTDLRSETKDGYNQLFTALLKVDPEALARENYPFRGDKAYPCIVLARAHQIHSGGKLSILDVVDYFSEARTEIESKSESKFNEDATTNLISSLQIIAFTFFQKNLASITRCMKPNTFLCLVLELSAEHRALTENTGDEHKSDLLTSQSLPTEKEALKRLYQQFFQTLNICGFLSENLNPEKLTLAFFACCHFALPQCVYTESRGDKPGIASLDGFPVSLIKKVIGAGLLKPDAYAEDKLECKVRQRIKESLRENRHYLGFTVSQHAVRYLLAAKLIEILLLYSFLPNPNDASSIATYFKKIARELALEDITTIATKLVPPYLQAPTLSMLLIYKYMLLEDKSVSHIIPLVDRMPTLQKMLLASTALEKTYTNNPKQYPLESRFFKAARQLAQHSANRLLTDFTEIFEEKQNPSSISCGR